MKLIFSLLFLFFVSDLLAQTDTTKKDSSTIYVEDIQPEFSGGMEALYNFIYSNLKFPAKSKLEGVKGKVFVKFIIAENGKVQDVKVAKGINEELDLEAVRVISILPDWKPGEQNGKKVRVAYTIPILFRNP